MNLTELLQSQERSQVARYGGVRPADFTRGERIDFIRVQALGLVDEVFEALHETGWKTWKNDGYGEVERETYLTELADVIVFWVNLVLAVGGTADEMSAIIKDVQAKNERRCREGY